MGETIREDPEPGPDEVERILALAAQMFAAWSRTPIAARAFDTPSTSAGSAS